MPTTNFAVVKAPGYRSHEMAVISAHATAEAASRAAAKDKSLSAIKTTNPIRKGATLWDDACGRANWSAI